MFQVIFKFCLYFSLLIARPLQASDDRYSEQLNITGTLTENLYAAAEDVRANFDSSDDVYIAGSKIDFEGRTTENLFLAGGDLSLKKSKARLAVMTGGNIRLADTEVRELVAAAGNLKINNVQVLDDLIIAGTQIDVDSDVNVAGSLTAAGGEINFAGKVAENVYLAGESVTLAGTFGKEVRVYAKKLFVRPGTVIQGDLNYTAENIDISAAAKIAGKTTAIPYTEHKYNAPKILRSIWYYLTVFGLLLIPAIVAAIWRKPVLQSSERIKKSFWENLGKGVAAALALPFIFVMLLVTGVGFPVAIAAVPFILVLKILAWSTAVFMLGQIFMVRFAGGEIPATGKKIFGYTLAGGVLMFAVLSIPFLGFVTALILFLTGLGSVLSHAKSYLHSLGKDTRE